MNADRPQFELPGDIEHYLAALSKLYARAQRKEALEVLANSQVRVHEAWDYDNWNGGTYGHALYLSVPEDIYLGVVERRQGLQTTLCSDLNKLHNAQNEHISEVFIEMQKGEDRDWRRESGALRSPQRYVGPDTLARIWGESGYRVFLSHKAEVKKEAGRLSDALRVFGISAFVAHENIRATKQWQDEIESALASADAFVALLSDKFHNSKWTDQEVGFAFGRGIPLICVKLGMDPYGFIGKFQALSCDWKNAPSEIAKLLIKQPRMLDAYIAALPHCNNFDEGIRLAEVLGEIDSLTSAQADAMADAFNRDPQLHGCWAFNGARPSLYGSGLAPHLSRATGNKYVFSESGDIGRRRG